ncbi:hypothetical protein JCM33374_g3446 [Metschnikowia sp. JCM 33374]|nr:hypothetical protein JCM33374_g3446 [Metschnikowia sp. JCM 33374]
MVALKRSSKRSASPISGERAKRLKSTSSAILHSYGRLPNINESPVQKRQVLDVFVWGTGSMCELGLGPEARTKEVKRPRLNPYLTTEHLGADGIVDFSVGGMHVLALDSNNVLWSWGTNDSKVLGRDTSGKENLKSMDDAEDSDDDGDLNPAESIPGKVENLPQTSNRIVQVSATDNISAVLYDNGEVYTWGTFRSNEGLLGYSKDVKIQAHPTKMKTLENIVQLATGKDHVLALDAKGIVYAWGNGQQFQLGRKILDRHKFAALEPHTFGLYDIKYIASGDFHCFAINSKGQVLTWGLNQYGQCGITNDQGELEDGSLISKPTIIPALKDKNIAEIVGGEHHSIALTKEGEIFTWGRYDMKEVGIASNELPAYTFRDQHGNPRSVPIPTLLRIADGTLKFKAIGVGSHHSFAVTDDGIVYAWGFGDTYAPGLGPLDGDVEIPTRIFNTATKNIDIQVIGAGGQFSVSGGLKLSELKAEKRAEKYENIDA